MYVYQHTESNLYTVGFFKPDGEWNPESDHETENAAALRVHWLNGGQVSHTCADRPNLPCDACLVVA